MSEEDNPRTLYVSNLDTSVSEDLLYALFSQIGAVKGCEIIRERGNDPYAFVEFTNHQCAATAFAITYKHWFLNKKTKVNWATNPDNRPKLDTSNHHHIFVGDLSPEIETQTLKEMFAPLGEITNCRIVRDPQTFKSKGCAFLSFVKKSETEAAINAINGQWLGLRSIGTYYPTRKPRSERPRHSNNSKTNYKEVYNQSSPTNCTMYCDGFTNGITDELIKKTFSPFGTIQDIRVFTDKGYAFIKFTTKEAATHAFESTHNTEINGSIVKYFWGKENGDPNSVGPNANHQAQQVTAGAGQYAYNYGQQNYWYPQSYPQMQGQFLQPAQYYGQYYGQQAQYMNSMRMPTPGAGAWQPTQATTAPPKAPASAPLPPGQQPTMETFTPIAKGLPSMVEVLKKQLTLSESTVRDLRGQIYTLQTVVEQLDQEKNELKHMLQMKVTGNMNGHVVGEQEPELEPVHDIKTSTICGNQRPASMYETREGLRKPASWSTTICQTKRDTEALLWNNTQSLWECGAPYLPPSKEVTRRTEQVTRQIQELWIAMQIIGHKVLTNVLTCINSELGSNALLVTLLLCVILPLLFSKTNIANAA